jgi:hypothetical protein
MKHLTATLCLTIAVLLGSAGVSWSADFQKGRTVTYEVTAPDGQVYEVTGPEGATREQLVSQVQIKQRKEAIEALYASGPGPEPEPEGFWCRKTGMGCKAKKRAKQHKLCVNIATSIYRERLEEGITDSSVWRLGGYDNAQDMAGASRRSSFARCMRR